MFLVAAINILEYYCFFVQRRIQDFHGGGGGGRRKDNLRARTVGERNAKSLSAAAGVHDSSRVFYALSCYLSLIFEHSV